MAKRRFTWLDGVCVALILALAVGALWFFTKDSGNSAEKQYEVTLRFKQATADPYDFYKVGDMMYFYTRSQKLGTITALSSHDLITEEYDAVNGKYVTVTDPQWKQIEMKVLAEGTMADGELSINGEPISIGLEFYPQSDTTRSVAVIWDIEEVAA
ncbi:MAG: DUF4330 family protein [Clostridia bacterium]|nr:DUF4330 family protein [Clostridia bacterium]